MTLGVRAVGRPTALLAGLLLAGLATRSHAQQPQTGASITGRITARGGTEPLPDSRVIVVGTSVFAVTNADGRFALRGVPAGNVEVRVLRVGYVEQKRPVTVTAGQTATLDFQLDRTLIVLQEVVTTATGQQRRSELGNSIATIDVVKKVQESPIKNMGDLLVAKAPGVQVLPSNMTGGGSRVRVRGTSSLSLTNDPIYVIDGVRLTSQAGASAIAIGVGGTAPSRVNDISPEEIENIEIVKGPSAATLYGTDASNGVIVITTKKGRAGAARWNVFGEAGQIHDLNDYPATYAILGHAPATPTTARRCFLYELSTGACVKDSTTVNNLFADPDLTMIKSGNRGQIGTQVSGGTEMLSYFVSGIVQNEVGPLGMPAYDMRRFDSLGVPVSDKWKRPNALRQGSFRTNLRAAINQKLDLNVQMGYIKLDQRLPQVDNNQNSFWYNAEVGPGFRGAGPGTTGLGSRGQPLNGYAAATPGDIFQFYTGQNIQRFLGSMNPSYRPFSWLETHGDFGVDLTDRQEFLLCQLQQCPDFGTQRQGRARDARTNLRNLTAVWTGTATWNPMTSVVLRSTAGTQYGAFQDDRADAEGQQLPPGAQTPADGTIPIIRAATTIQKTLGLFVEEQVSFRDRLTVTGAVRSDQNSAFGTDFQRVYYPKASLSWVMSDESFFPTNDILSYFRPRISFGASGVQPGPNDAARTYATTLTSIAGGDVGGLRSNLLGNAKLKPERSTEVETGFDARFFNSRVNLELTYYNKMSKDALIDQTLAPSGGTSNNSIKANLGSVKNYGYEALINTQVLTNRYVSWDITFNGSHNTNKLVTLGKDATGKDIPPIIGTTISQKAGYPLQSYWTRPYTWSDANKDGIITPSEVTIGDTAVFMGYSQPRLELSVTNGLDLFNRRLRITALVDHKGGFRVLNSEQQFLCQQSVSCKDISSLNVPLWRQARAVANRFTPVQTPYGFIEKNDFTRIREITASINVPENFTKKYMHARTASLNLGVRNIAVFSDWTGVDPEQNYGQGDTQQTLLTAGPPRFYTARLSLSF
ncbi:MAG TPA: SusC/RagA family TonB-linked outer membrane protein [Gemmatimonadaceae bacterium]|nr:SusC/RagA family TonB-linked outer membrane protein [Gemmatimonadaceae bacterium]